jgi:hypothetical protein
MNGRIYDPLLGRFQSADAVVQFPGSLQSYNRYSYVENNPLSLVDPSGFLSSPPPSQLAPALEIVKQHPQETEAVLVAAARFVPIVAAAAVTKKAADTFGLAIQGGQDAWDAFQKKRKSDQDIKEWQEQLRRRGTAPNPADPNQRNQPTPHEVKIDEGAIQNSQGDLVNTTQSPNQQAKPDAPKPEPKKDDSKNTSDSKDSKSAASDVVHPQRADSTSDKRPWVEADAKTLKVKTADSQIPGSLKKSDSYRSELGNLTRDELQALKDKGGDQSQAAGQMLKLLKETERLMEKKK